MQDLKLVCFDLNETLIQENTWFDLNVAMGVTKEEDALFMKWYEEGEISYEEGQNLLSQIYRERGKANKKAMLKAIGKYKYARGAKESVEYLKNKGYKLALITGSIDLLAKKVADELGIEMWAAHNFLQFDDQGDFERIICHGDDADAKLNWLRVFCEEEGIKITQAVCIGDGYNDAKIFKATQHGVAFAGSQIEKYAWKTIRQLSDLGGFL